MVDKNDAMIAFLKTCPTIRDNPLYFNFGNLIDNANQGIAQSDSTQTNRTYVDGSVQKRYTFNLDSYKSIAYNVLIDGYNDENSSDLKDVQQILDWVNSQADAHNYPNFGTTCVIDEMTTLTTSPQLLGVNTSLNPPIAIYRIAIQIIYVDTSKTLWG